MKIQAKASTKTQLAQQYGVHINTFKKWLSDFPAIKLSPKTRILTPKQVQLIYEEFGEPPTPQQKQT